MTAAELAEAAGGIHGIDFAEVDATTLWCAAAGFLQDAWRNGPIEAVHGSDDRLSDGVLFGTNVATTRSVATALLVAHPEPAPWEEIAAELAKGSRPIGGTTLRKLAGPNALGRIQRHARRNARTVEYMIATRGWEWARTFLAARGAMSDWFGVPWWPQIVDAFLEEEPNPPMLVDELRHGLVTRPEDLSAEALDWCTLRGIGFAAVEGRRRWAAAGSPRWAPAG